MYVRGWRLEVRGWRLEVGGWRLEVGGSESSKVVLRGLEVRGWMLEVQKAESAFLFLWQYKSRKSGVLKNCKPLRLSRNLEPRTSNFQLSLVFVILELQVFSATRTTMRTANAGEAEFFEETGGNDTGWESEEGNTREHDQHGHGFA